MCIRDSREDDPTVNEDEFFYSQWITLGCGFSLMFLALIKFHGMDFIRWIKKKITKKGKSQTDNVENDNDQASESREWSDDYDPVLGESNVENGDVNTGFEKREPPKKVKKA